MDNTCRQTIQVVQEDSTKEINMGETPSFYEGATYTPYSKIIEPNEVEIGWSNNRALKNPDPVKLVAPKGEMGVQGVPGPQGKPGVDGTVSFDKLTDKQKAQLKGEKGDKGDPGIKGEAGKDGKTPIRGIDYWTEQDKQEIENSLEPKLKPYALKTEVPNVPAWALSETKPTYNATEVGALPSSTKIPTNNNELVNGANYQNETQVINKINDAVGKLTGFDFQIVSELPTEGKKGIIYLVALKTKSSQNVYEEFIWIGTTFEKIGTTQVDLSDYAKKSDIPKNTSELNNDSNFINNTALNSYAHTTYVDQQDTETLNQAKNYTNNKVPTAKEKETWNNKANTNDIPTLMSELYNDTGYVVGVNITKIKKMTLSDYNSSSKDASTLYIIVG